tara:strand:+ start:224 stop:862 length:639 start_codon:yes stop_codon:yes gene_type:complete
MAHPATTTSTLWGRFSQGILRKAEREASNQAICEFVNSHRENISASDVKNGQGLVATYALHKLMEQSPDRGGFEPYDIADYIRENKLWFKPSIKDVNGVFTVGNGPLNPCIKEFDGVKQQTMYAEDKVMRGGRSRISNSIMDTLKSNVISPKRQHTLIMRCVDQSVGNEYCLRLRSPSKFAIHLQAFKMGGGMVPRGEWTSSQWKGTHFKFE